MLPPPPPPPPLMDTSKKAYKIKDYPKKAKGMSFFAFIFSIFIYIFIFYMFNISPKSLLSNTKFWFFISNTLIFIIATDYGIFTSLVEKQDIHDEYLNHTTQARNNASSFVTQYPEMVKRMSVPKSEPPERVLGVIKSEPKKLSDGVLESTPEDVAKMNNDDAMQKKMKEARKFSRSKSERCSTKVDIDGDYNKKCIMRRSRGDVNEFSTMSDEELNRRVEEFIQRFNRQIRLQRETNLDQN